MSAFHPLQTSSEIRLVAERCKKPLHITHGPWHTACMEQDHLTPAARQHLVAQERLNSERLKAAQAKGEKLRAGAKARGPANDERRT